MTTDRTGAPTDVLAESGRFSISVDGRLVGFAQFVDRDGQRIFSHTEVIVAFQGRGLATILVRHALEATRDAGLKVVPRCWMVAEFIDKNPEFADLLDRS
ncbi:MAG: GNAT family N-acetyltransferase [Mycolicibacterium sp.]|uniref:GNAT family N-acetyltransferase n=1 Tax=Mycolicibacterium sp. TaxID=2320850 RepID=UPI003D0E8686